MRRVCGGIERDVLHVTFHARPGKGFASFFVPTEECLTATARIAKALPSLSMTICGLDHPRFDWSYSPPRRRK